MKLPVKTLGDYPAVYPGYQFPIKIPGVGGYCWTFIVFDARSFHGPLDIIAGIF